MHVLIAGSREFKVDEAIVRPLVAGVVDMLPPDAILITGGARGVDQWAEEAAKKRGMYIRTFEPDWGAHGKAAGPIRNREMVATADKVYVFWNGESRGTKSTIDAARAADKLTALATITLPTSEG